MQEMRAEKYNAIVTVADERFLPAACCTLISANDHLPNKQITELILVATDVSSQQVDQASLFLQSRGVEAQIISVSTHDALLHGLQTDDRLPLATYVRLRLDSLLDTRYDRVLYLDADTRVLSPLEPLFNVKIENSPLAAVKDIYMYVQNRLEEANNVLGSPVSTDYFNAGVMLMNWRAMKSEHILAKALEFARRRSGQLRAYDQDALNAIVAGRFVHLDPRWNLPHYYYQNGGTREAWIKHFTGEKPWSMHRPLIWTEDAKWYAQLLQQSPWPTFVADSGVLNWFHARDVHRRLRNYSRVLGSVFVPFLMTSGAKRRAAQFLQFKPEEVIDKTHAWMDRPNRP
jgi:lipopolysaccharide biosynthesis glycosyltransferase